MLKAPFKTVSNGNQPLPKDGFIKKCKEIKVYIKI